MVTQKPTREEIRARLAQYVDAQASGRQRITDLAKKAAVARARRMSDENWRDYDSVTTFAKDMTRMQQAQQRQAAAVTNAYQARVLQLFTQRPAAPSRQADTEDLRGIPQESVYGRVADFYRYLRDNPDRGEDEATAQKLAVQRVEELAEMDIQLAVRAQNQKFMTSKATVKGFRRVIHPELNESGVSCGLCVVASHQSYARGDLLPIHFRCKCEVVPIVDETRDYGLELNRDDLAAVYAAAGGTLAQQLKETRFAVHEHGELGPVLTYKGDRFRGPSVVEDQTTHDKESPDS